MRTEELIKESELYAQKGNCFIHCEHVDSGDYNVIVAGDKESVINGLYACLKEVAEAVNMSSHEVIREIEDIDASVLVTSRDL